MLYEVMTLSVVVTRRLPEVVETRMKELFDVELREDDRPLTREDVITSYSIHYTKLYDMRSEQRVQRNHRMRSILVTTLVLLTVAAGIGAGVALQQRRLAQVEADTATATTNFLIRLFQVSDPWTTAGAPGSEITAREA